MNTTGIQNYLSNVFRPIYTFDSTLSNFTPKLELSNIDTYSGNNVSVFRADVGDANSNVYVGSNAGNAYDTLRGCSKVTAVGYGAGFSISNVNESVYLGWYAGTNAADASGVIAIGVGAVGGGNSNIFVGNGTGTTGNSNIFIGHSIDPTNVSNQIRIGYDGQTPIAGNIAQKWVGLGGILAPTTSSMSLDVSGNTRIRDASGGTLDVSGGLVWSSGGYASVQGSVNTAVGTTTIGTLRRGILHVSAIDQASSNNRAAYTYFAWTTSDVTSMASTSNGDTNITTSGTSIQISNASSPKTYDYSITYFPLP